MFMNLIQLSSLRNLHTFDSWIAYKNYRFIWVGNFFGNNAQWLQLLTVGWLVRDLTIGSSTSSLLVITVGAINTLPGLVVGPWAGVLGDRVDRRKLLMLIQTFMAVMAISFALLMLSGKIMVWHAYAYVIISGICRSFAMPLRQALIANTVPREALGNALAANVLTITSSRLFGPFFGGVLIATLGFSWNFVLEAGFYVCMVLSLLPMKTPYREPGKARVNKSPAADLKEGILYIWKGERIIFFLIMLSLVPNVIIQPFMFLLPVFTDEILGRGADVGGALLAINGAGGFLAAFIIASVGFIFKKGMVVFGTAVLSCVVVILLSFTPWLAPAIIMIALLGFSQSTFRTTNSTLIQSLVPDELRSRVTSLRSYGQGFVVFTSLLIGWIADLSSASVAIMIMGGFGLAMTLAYLLIARRVRKLS